MSGSLTSLGGDRTRTRTREPSRQVKQSNRRTPMQQDKFTQRRDVLIIFSRLSTEAIRDVREELYQLKVVSRFSARRNTATTAVNRFTTKSASTHLSQREGGPQCVSQCAYVTVHSVRDAARVLTHFASLPRFAGAIGRSRSIFVSPPSWQSLSHEEKNIISTSCINPSAAMTLIRAGAKLPRLPPVTPSSDEEDQPGLAKSSGLAKTVLKPLPATVPEVHLHPLSQTECNLVCQQLTSSDTAMPAAVPVCEDQLRRVALATFRYLFDDE